MEKIILASSSLRRKRILESLNIPFKSVSPEIDEKTAFTKNIELSVKKCAELKVKSVMENNKAKWIAGFDTVVELKNEILGKPRNRYEAKTMLKKLSGVTHKVHTGVSLACSYKISTDICTTFVTFNKMTEKEIEFYLNTGEWNGVAGAYRIQERGSFYVNSIKGSYSNVVGLPISLFYVMLCRYNFPINSI
jgi:septum formation protein